MQKKTIFKKRKRPNQHYSKIDILIFLFVFFLPTQFGKHFFFPFSYISGVRVDYLAPTIYFIDILALLLIISHFKLVIRFFSNPIVLVILGAFILNIFGALSAPIAVYKTLRIVEFISIFGIFANKKFSERIILSGLLFGSLFQVFLMILQVTFKHSIQGVLYFFGERFLTLTQPGIAKGILNGIEILRGYGTFSHPNSAAGFYLLIYVFVLFSKKFDEFSFAKNALLTCCALIIFLTFSKFILFVFLFANIFYYLVSRKILDADCKICMLSRISMLIILVLIFSSAKTDPESLQKRAQLTIQSLQMIRAHPFFGVGLGNYLIGARAFGLGYLYITPQPVHNIFLLFAAEMGIIFSVIVGYFIINGVYNNRHNLVFLSCLAIITITGLFDHYWLTLIQNFLLMGIILGSSIEKSAHV